ncbi:aspartate kinase [Gracilimonas sp. Q87]|uniref:aspartate kinase n=1 Tax=Gracilimonas sp. Q87 TaxID=3384766 RepID=UPI00398455A3
MQINVLKFGGTSMADHKTWKKVLDIIKEYEWPVVIVSATARTTRQLVEAAHLAASGKLDEAIEISGSIQKRHQGIVENFLEENPHPKNLLIKDSCIKNMDAKIGKLNKLLSYTARQEKLSPQMKDAIAATGEQISSYLLAQCGLALDMMTQHIEARKLIKTDNEYGKANPNKMLINQHCGSLETVLENGFTPIIGGFYGEAPDKTITTLGFEGSDYSASLIGGAVGAETIEIWTDVSGVYTGDPRFIPEAKPLSEISYFDATEMAYFGAKVLHPSTLKPAQERNIPVYVKNMFNPEDPGTRIVREADHDLPILAMSFKQNISLLTVSAYETLMGFSFLPQVFSVLEKYRLPVDAVNTTEASVTIAISDDNILGQLSKEFIEIGSVNIEKNKGLLTLIGCSVQSADNFRDLLLAPLSNLKIDMLSYTKEKRIFNLVTDNEELLPAAQKVHRALFS